MPSVAFCLRHFSADFIICTCEFDFRQAQVSNLPGLHCRRSALSGHSNTNILVVPTSSPCFLPAAKSGLLANDANRDLPVCPKSHIPPPATRLVHDSTEQ